MSTPVELYRFTIDTRVWTWTSGDQAVDYNGETYTPAPIGREAIEQGPEINRANLKIKLPRDNALAMLYLTQVPDAQASVTLYRQSGATTAAYWKGRIAGVSATGSEVTLDCESAFNSLRRTGLRAHYQTGCRHALYHRGCDLDLADWGVDSLVTAVAGPVLTIPGAAPEADGWYLGGMVQTDDAVMRWITGHAGAQVTISWPFTGLAEAIAGAGYGNNYGNAYGGVGVTIYPGCDRTKETCNSKFNNLLNHGGFPWIPQRNPFDGASIV